MKIVTIIVVYNGRKWLDKLISSLLLSNQTTTIIIIDNNSIDGSADYIQKNYPEVQLIRLDDNLGFGRANNLGIKKAIEQEATHVFLLNQDAWITENTIKELLSVSTVVAQDSHLLSPMHLNGAGDLLDASFYNYITLSSSRALYSDIFMNKQVAAYPVDFVNAAAWFIPIQLIQECGGFNPLFPHYGEDVDFCNRLNYFGKTISVVPKSIIFHDRELKRNKRLLLEEAKYTFISRLYAFTDLKRNIFKSYFAFLAKDIASILLAIMQFEGRRIALRLIIQFYIIINFMKIKKYRGLGKKKPSIFLEDDYIFTKILFQ